MIVPGAYTVEFADFWLADQMNSLASVFLDLEFMIVFFTAEGSVTGSQVKHFLKMVYRKFGLKDATKSTDHFMKDKYP